MVLALVRVARLCLIIGAILTVLAFTLSGAVIAHDPAQPGQWIAGAFVGYLVGVVVAGVTFGAMAALFDIQQQIRVLVDLTRAQQVKAVPLSVVPKAAAE